MSEFLLELYSEEIPPNLQINARNDLQEKIKSFLIEESLKYGSLNAFSSPTRLTILLKNFSDKIKISSKDALVGNIDSLNSILSYYEKKSAIIIYFDERYDYELERFIGNIKFKVFSQDVFTELKLTGISLGDRISKKTQIGLLARESLIALNDWWKNKTTISEYDENNLNEYFFEIESLDLKESIEIEKLLKSSSFFKKLIPINFEKNKIIFKLSSFGSIEKTKLALRSLNLEIVNTKKPKTYKLLKLR